MVSLVLWMQWTRAVQGKWVSSSSWWGEVSSPSELLNPVPAHKLASGWLLLLPFWNGL
jgi:hypothetical protein